MPPHPEVLLEDVESKGYATKQVEAYAVQEDRDSLVITSSSSSSRRREPARETHIRSRAKHIAYLRFQEKCDHVETIRVSDAVNVDFSPDGTIYGVELLNANDSCRPATTGR